MRRVEEDGAKKGGKAGNKEAGGTLFSLGRRGTSQLITSPDIPRAGKWLSVQGR